MTRLVTLICFLAASLGVAFGVQCHVGTGKTTIVMNCAKSSDKCVTAGINEITAKVCYSQMDWSQYPTFIPRLGCQKFTQYGISSEICICRGDRCNEGGFESSDTSTINAPAPNATEAVALTTEERPMPEPTMSAHVGFEIHHTSTAKLIAHGQNENVTKYSAPARTSSAVSCYVGVGTNTIVMQCASSDKCVKSKVNDVIARVCYSQITWSAYPAFHPLVGCQIFSAEGVDTEICICTGDLCNEGGFSNSNMASTNSPSMNTREASVTTSGNQPEPEPTMPADVAFGIHHTSTEKLITNGPNQNVTKYSTSTKTNSAVSCYVGTGTNMIIMQCASSDKCVKSKVNKLIGKVCYSQMDWSRYPAFDPRVGCQKFSAFDLSTEICICTGDLCNKGGFDSSDMASTNSPATKTPEAIAITTNDRPEPEPTVPDHVGFGIHHTSTEKLIAHGQSENPAKHSTSAETNSVVSCYVGVGDNMIVMQCASSDKCVKSKVNDLIARVCYSHMDWSQYPTFDPRVGCQKSSVAGIDTEICICTGDKCNEGGFELRRTSAMEFIATTTTASIDATTDELLEATTDASTDTATDAATDDSTDAATDDSTDAATNDSTDAATNDSTDVATDDPIKTTTDDPTKATNDGPIEATTDESIEATTDESIEATTDGPIEATTDESIEATTDAIEATTDEVFSNTSTDTAFGLHCYVGAGTTKILMDCGTSSDKCVKTRVNDMIAKVCYSQMDWTRFPMFNPAVGCQKFSGFGMDTEICICTGDKCNEGGFEERGIPEIDFAEVDMADSGTGATDYMTTEANVGFEIHRTLNATVISPQEKTVPISTTSGLTTGVKCYVGAGETKTLMDCGSSSDKCVTSKLNENTARICYSQMDWSLYPGFNPSVGCQKFNMNGWNAEICICTGDGCNGGYLEETFVPVEAPDATESSLYHMIWEELFMTTTTDDDFETTSRLVSTATTGTSKGVQCYVGAGSTKYLMDCGTSSEKCAKTKVNDVVARFCFSQMDWSKYPTFNPRIGCQSFSASGFNSEICICVGDKCNDGGFELEYSSTKSYERTETTISTTQAAEADSVPKTTGPKYIEIEVDPTSTAKVDSTKSREKTSPLPSTTAAQTTSIRKSGKFVVNVDESSTTITTIETKSVVSTTSGANHMCASTILVLLMIGLSRFVLI